jgi:hypothetical protein
MKGPYRQFLSDISQDWWGNETFVLFEAADTLQFHVEDKDVSDRYSWIPNRRCLHPFHLSLYRLIGQLLGAIVYADVQVEIIWASLVWKSLVKETIQWKELSSLCMGMPLFLTSLSNMSEEEWESDIGGFLDYIDGVKGILKDPAVLQECLNELKRAIASSSEASSMEGSLNFSFSEVSIPFSIRDGAIKIFEKYFLRTSEPQLNAIREGLFSGMQPHS